MKMFGIIELRRRGILKNGIAWQVLAADLRMARGL
jgi:hypothetical protein